MRQLFLILVGLLALMLAACASASAPAAPQTSAGALAATPVSVQAVTIEAIDDLFRPERVTVTVGTPVTWVNVGQRKHTVTFDGLFDVDLAVGQSFTHTFTRPGTYNYSCVIHSESDTEGMIGTLTVIAK